jgi:hypothetical protein
MRIGDDSATEALSIVAAKVNYVIANNKQCELPNIAAEITNLNP